MNFRNSDSDRGTDTFSSFSDTYSIEEVPNKEYYLEYLNRNNINPIVFLRNDYCFQHQYGYSMIDCYEPLKVVAYNRVNKTYHIHYENEILLASFHLSESSVDTLHERLSGAID